MVNKWCILKETGLYWSVLQLKTKIVSSHTADSKPVKQEVNGTVILPPLVFPVPAIYSFPVPRSAPLRATMIGTAFEHLFFSTTNGAERNSQDKDGYTPSNIAFFSQAIYSFPVPLRSERQ